MAWFELIVLTGLLIFIIYSLFFCKEPTITVEVKQEETEKKTNNKKNTLKNINKTRTPTKV